MSFKDVLTNHCKKKATTVAAYWVTWQQLRSECGNKCTMLAILVSYLPELTFWELTFWEV